MPRNRKTSLQHKKPQPATPKDIDVKDSLYDNDDLLMAFDAWTYVFLHSHVSMTDPILQLQIEHDDLDYQWSRYLRGQDNMDPDPKFRFLENHHILEFGLEEDFITRHDLAVMVRDLFMRDLDLTRLNRGLSGYIRMFRPQLDNSASVDVDDPGMYWKTLMQIVCLVMALCMRDKQEMAYYSPVEDLNQRWERKTRGKRDTTVNLQRISDSAMAWMFEVATRAAQDTSRLYGLYQNTLRLIVVQLEVAIQELDPPLNEGNLVDNLMEIRDNQVACLRRNFEQVGQPALPDIDSDWFEEPYDEEGTVREERKPEFTMQEDTEFSARDRYGHEGGLTSSGEVEEKVTGVEEGGNGVEDKAGGIGDTSDSVQEKEAAVKEKAEEKNAIVKVEDEEDEEEEEEPLTRRRKAPRQDYHPIRIAPEGVGSSGINGQSRGIALSFTRSGLENLAQASPLLSKSVHNNIAKTVVQDSLSADLASTATVGINLQQALAAQQSSIAQQISTSTTPKTSTSTAQKNSTEQETSTAKQTTTAQQTSTTRQGQEQIMPLPKRKSSQTPQPEPVTKPGPLSPSKESSPTHKTAATTAPPAGTPAGAPSKSLLAPERVGVKQSEPDPFISIKKTKRVFKAPSDSEFEDDDADVPARELKKKSTKESVPTPPLSDKQSPVHGRFQSTMDAFQEAGKAMRQSGSNGNSSSSNSSGSAGPSNRNGLPVTSVSQVLQNRTPLKEKRKYRPWSSKEVDRLMELAPQFLHDPTQGDAEGRKKRNVKWAQLKAHDERHGNVLKHRTQVNLKDKYREKTDEGQHRQEVIMINRAKADAVPHHKFSAPKRGF
ncbi:hypothetical protein EC957_007453 [Mortierella hygrophila]|uniref:Uncharacterized protein n=1 Tax=Mortierella hygrophila TaxID=979708 RepID=A0A9P6K5H7_9FUNG|nr:hypothetical protein EC957_007453 [Mortierella hygrophila]